MEMESLLWCLGREKSGDVSETEEACEDCEGLGGAIGGELLYRERDKG